MSQMDINLAQHALSNTIWFGTIAADVLDFDVKAYVNITDFDTQNRIGPCRWQSRNTVDKPLRGDWCAVVLDNRGNWWILVWWPIAFE